MPNVVRVVLPRVPSLWFSGVNADPRDPFVALEDHPRSLHGRGAKFRADVVFPPFELVHERIRTHDHVFDASCAVVVHEMLSDMFIYQGCLLFDRIDIILCRSLRVNISRIAR